MKDLLENNALKSLLYILFFGGMLKLGGMLLTWLWNSYISIELGLEEITFLEAVGMISFSYLLYSGIKFGFGINPDKKTPNDNLSYKYFYKPYLIHKKHSKCKENLKYLSNDEKEKLKEELAKYCGFNHPSEQATANPNEEKQRL